VPTAALAASLTGGLATAANAAPMAAFGADLVDATDPVLVVVDDAAARSALRASLTLLADALVAGDPAGSNAALTAARARLAAVPGDAALYELAPVALALDKAELTIAGDIPAVGTP
jgi:hypothetical protein